MTIPLKLHVKIFKNSVLITSPSAYAKTMIYLLICLYPFIFYFIKETKDSAVIASCVGFPSVISRKTFYAWLHPLIPEVIP